MKLSRRSIERFGPVFLAVVIQGTLLIGRPLDPTSAVIAESVFAMVTEPIGVAATPGRLLVTKPHCEGSGGLRQVLSIDSSGTVRVFATLTQRGTGAGVCFEEYIAVAPASPDPTTVPGFPTPNPIGFASNFVYVTQGPDIKKISPDGLSVTLFKHLSPCASSQNGITFDKVGTFGFHLIVVCSSGEVWLLDANGNTVTPADTPSAPQLTTSPLVNLSELATPPIEGPDVAPLTFEPFGGHLLVTSEAASAVLAVSPTGLVTSPIADVHAAEIVNVIPTTKCSLGGGVYFTAIFPTSIDKLPLSAFTGLGDGKNALVPSELGTPNVTAGLTLLTSMTNEGSFIGLNTFRTFSAHHEGAAFLDCGPGTPPLLLKAEREPKPINPRAPGLVTVFIFATTNFNPETLIAESLRYGITGTETSLAFCEPHLAQMVGRGGPARICHFHKDKLGITSEGIFRGHLFLKGNYQLPPGETGDPAGEGDT